MKKENMKKQRKKSAVVTSLLALALVVTGTFAWTSISQRALNDLTRTGNPGGRIHDDYDRTAVEEGTGTTANKDVYAENFGENDLYVRIKLSEYLEIDGTAVTGGNKDDRSTWIPYVLGNTETARSNVTWKQGGKKDYLPTFNTDKESLETDATGHAVDYVVGSATGIGDGSHDYFKDNGPTFTDPNDASVQHTVKSTETQAKAPISMADWKANGSPTGKFWVVDTDGWAYWAEKLAPGKATSLLLDDLTFVLPDGEMYYAIDVIGEFATQADLYEFRNSEHGEPTSDAESLLEKIAGITTTYELVVTPAEDEVTMLRGSNQTFTATLVETKSNGMVTEIENANITYLLADATGSKPLTSGTAVTVRGGRVSIADKETLDLLKLTIKADDYKISKEIMINVQTLEVIEGANYNYIEDPETGVVWRVLNKDEAGNLLVITEKVYGYGTPYSNGDTFVLFENSNLKTVMDTWYADGANVGDAMRSTGLGYKYDGDAVKGTTGAGIEYDYTVGDEFAWNYDYNLKRAYTYADTSASAPEVFALSISEVTEYFGNSGDRIGENEAGEAVRWVLRSVGSSDTSPTVHVSDAGHYRTANTKYNIRGFRVAMWINP